MTREEAAAILRDAGKIIFSSNLVSRDANASSQQMKGAQAVGLVLWLQCEFEPHDPSEAALYVWDILMDELCLNLADLEVGGTRWAI